jgi:phospholipid transport system substrate-binding protein
MRYLLFMIIFVLLFTGTVLGSESDDVKTLLKSNVDAVVELLQNDNMDKTERNQRILDIITPVFDFKTMAKLTLGKKYWPTLNETQQAEFSDLFIRRLQESYLDKLDIYTDEKVLYGEPLTMGTKIHMPTTLVSKDSNIEMLYKFYHSAESWKIYDVEIGGVSVIQTYRSQFDGVLREGSVADLLGKLKDDGSFVLPEAGEEGARPGND